MSWIPWATLMSDFWVSAKKTATCHGAIIKQYGEAIASFKIKGFQNFAEESVRSYKPVNIQTHSGTKYSLFNKKFIHEEKYSPVAEGIKGMFETAVVMKDPGERQYPYERFYRLRRGEL